MPRSQWQRSAFRGFRAADLSAITGLVAWHRARDITPVADGTSMSATVKVPAATGSPFTEALDHQASGLWGKYRTNAAGSGAGQPFVRTSDAGASGVDSDVGTLSPTLPFTIMFVARTLATDAANRGLVGILDGTSGTKGFRIGGNSGTWRVRAVNNGGWRDTTVALPTNEWHLWEWSCAIWDGTSPNSDYVVRKDGVIQAALNGMYTNAQPSAIGSGLGIAWGVGDGAMAGGLGDVSESAVVNHWLTAGERAIVKAYFQEQYSSLVIA